MVQREESVEQVIAFEAYYALGPHRSLAKLVQRWSEVVPEAKKRPCLSTLKNWSKRFNWQERISIKDHAVAAGIERKTTRAAIDRKARWLAQTEARINSAFNDDGSPKLSIEDNRALNETVKLALTLLGEPETQEVKHRGEIKIIRVKSSGERDGRDSG